MIMSSHGIEPCSRVPQTRALTNMLTRLNDNLSCGIEPHSRVLHCPCLY